MGEGKSNQMHEGSLQLHQDYGFADYAVAHPQTLSLTYYHPDW
jgi:hypothetical protein